MFKVDGISELQVDINFSRLLAVGTTTHCCEAGHILRSTWHDETAARKNVGFGVVNAQKPWHLHFVYYYEFIQPKSSHDLHPSQWPFQFMAQVVNYIVINFWCWFHQMLTSIPTLHGASAICVDDN